MALTEVNSLGIKDDSIVNADIKSDAAIALSKLASTPAVLSGSTDNTVCTVTGANAITGESNVHINGGHLIVGHTASTTTSNGEGPFVQVKSTDSRAGASFIRHSADAAAGGLYIGKSRNGTIGSNTVVQDDDELGRITFSGDDGTDINSVGAEIQAHVDGTPGSNDMPGRLTFRTTADGAAATTERMRITSDGKVNIPDTGKFTAGASDDLQLYHDGTNSSIKNTTGDLYIDDAGGNIYIQAKAGEQSIVAFADGAVDLYHDNTKKFETTSSGAKVSGSIQIPCDGTLANRNIAFERSNGSGDFSTFFGVTNYPDNSDYDDADDGYWANISAKGGCVVVINSDGAHDSGRNNYDHFSVYQKAGSEVSSAGRRLFSVDNVGGVQFGQAGIRIDNSWAGQPSITVQRNNNANVDNTNDSAYMRIHGIGETHGSWTGAAAAGADFSANLLIDGSSYDTSDRRAKTDIVDCPYGLDVINKLQPRKYQLVNSRLEPQGDDNINLGFIAQEIKEHIPECVNYLGDEADKPNEKGYAKAYALDIGEVIPVLVKAVQELSAKVAALEAK